MRQSRHHQRETRMNQQSGNKTSESEQNPRMQEEDQGCQPSPEKYPRVHDSPKTNVNLTPKVKLFRKRFASIPYNVILQMKAM
jgi:hypothetical protein